MLEYLSRRLRVTFYFLFYVLFVYLNNTIRNITDAVNGEITGVSLWGGPSLCTFAYFVIDCSLYKMAA